MRVRFFAVALLSAAAAFVPLTVVGAAAQGRNEVSASVGAGSLIENQGGGATPVWNLAYDFHVTKRWTVEGALDIFYDRFLTSPGDPRSTSRDDYTGAELAIVFHPINCCETGRLLPFVTAGIGKTTTDFTEVPASVFYRFGAGLSYHINERFGLRAELRDERMTALDAWRSSAAHLPSIRVGIVRRF
jgi:hypothetical protein